MAIPYLYKEESEPLLRRHLLLLILCAASVVVFWSPLLTLATVAIRDERYTATLAVPFLSLAMVWIERNRICAEDRCAPGAGSAYAFCGLAILAISARSFVGLPKESILPIRIFALVLVCAGTFVYVYARVRPGVPFFRCFSFFSWSRFRLFFGALVLVFRRWASVGK